MKRLLRTALVAAIAGLLSGQGAIQPVPPAQQVATKTFTPQTLYFMSSTGVMVRMALLQLLLGPRLNIRLIVAM